MLFVLSESADDATEQQHKGGSKLIETRFRPQMNTDAYRSEKDLSKTVRFLVPIRVYLRKSAANAFGATSSP